MKKTSVLLIVLIFLTASRLCGQAPLQVGYAVLSGDVSGRLPVGTALFSYTNAAGVLVSEAAVGASQPIRSGRIYVDESSTKTGFAMANPSTQPAAVTLTLRNSSGSEVARQTLPLLAQQQISRYVGELFPSRPANLTGSLTFESDQAVAAITLRESRNAFGEPLYTTLPVVDLSTTAATQSLTFPQIAAGEGYTTQLVLINTTAASIRGTVRLFGSDGLPLTVRLGGNSVTQFDYQIDTNGTYTASLDALTGLNVGYAQVVPDASNPAPGGSAIFQYRQTGSLVSEAGAVATGTTTARIFVDQAGTQTGVAIANPSSQAVPVTLTLMDRSGFVQATTVRTLPVQGHVAAFTNELFPTAPAGFTGLMEIQSPTPVVPIALKLTANVRGDLILTTLPVADLTRISSATSAVFAHLAIGSEFATRLIVLNVDRVNATSGRFTFFQSDGNRMTIPFEGTTGSQFNYQVSSGSGRQYLPGNANQLASLFIVAPGSSQVTSEIAVNEGNTVRAGVRALDSTGRLRDDFDATYVSLDRDVATVDAAGNISAKKAGFSTLTIAARGVVANATITVVTVDSGIGGFDVTGVAQDLARRIYLAATADHTVLVAPDIKQSASVYAGLIQQPGLKNDLRLQSQFKEPSFLTIGQADGSLFVSDSANHAIRRVQPGTGGRVETLAGTGTAGTDDGSIRNARFNNPQGIALDDRGNLWIADSGNHSIRRINLATGNVETIAGKPGSAGFADGTRDVARFTNPLGIAIEPEPTAQQLDRERRGLPPPPVSVIVADSGNGVVRRVKENGEVTTIDSGVAGLEIFETFKSLTKGRSSAATTLFGSPAGVAVDARGNIYVTDAATGQVRTLLQSGGVVDAVQANTFRSPKSVIVTEGSRILVTDKNNAARQIQYGEPRIASVTPNRIGSAGGVSITIKGSNFASDSIVVVGNVFLTGVKPVDTQTITFVAPRIPSGRTTLTVQNRGGIAQTSLLIDAISLDAIAPGSITTVAGGTTFAGDGQTATSAVMTLPYAIALDAAGNLFIADSDNHRIRRVAATSGLITTVAGNGIPGESGDDGPATAASLLIPEGIAIDAAGNLYIASAFRIRKIDVSTGLISTVAGSTDSGFAGDNGPATAALLIGPQGLTFDQAGNLYIADFYGDRVRKVAAGTGIITTVAGTGQASYSGDRGPATAAALNGPTAVATDRAGNLFIADGFNSRIRRVDAVTRIITTVAGTGVTADSADGGPAVAASFVFPSGISVDANGNLVVLDAWGRVRYIDFTTGNIYGVAGTGDIGFSGDGGPARNARMFFPMGVGVDGAGNIIVADTYNNRIRRISAITGTINTIAGSSDIGGDNAPATLATLNFPRGIAFDPAGGLFISDGFNNRIRKVDASTGLITTVAGTGVLGIGDIGDGSPAKDAMLFYPEGISVNRAGDLFIADSSDDRIRRVAAQSGIITTVAGNGNRGYSGNGGVATAAMLNRPRGVTTDVAGNVYIADTKNHRIRRVDAVTGIITTIGGTGQPGYGGDGGPATAAILNAPEGIIVDSAGNILFADTDNNRIRRIAAASGIITTVAGNGVVAFSGDNGPATSASLNQPEGIALDAAGNLYISDSTNNRIRRVSAATGIITTIAGSGHGLSGDGGPATAATLFGPSGIAFNARGDLFISDWANSRIRAIRAPIP